MAFCQSLFFDNSFQILLVNVHLHMILKVLAECSQIGLLSTLPWRDFTHFYIFYFASNLNMQKSYLCTFQNSPPIELF